MRLEQYLTEKYVNTIKHSSSTYDMFVNPSKKEIAEIESQSFNGEGFRFLADFKEKKVYIWSTEIIHAQMIEDNPKTFTQILWNEYWAHAMDADRFLSGTIENGSVESDIWRAFDSKANRLKGNMAREGLQKAPFWNMERNDFKWLAKYGINPNEAKRLVTNVTRWFK